MLRRCYDSNSPNYKYYGAKGVKVCQEWHDFEAFYADMGVCPSDFHSLDRIDSNGDYSPSNCRWATSDVQHANRNVPKAKGSVSFVDGKWRALVRVKGKSASRRFVDRSEAVAWAAEKAEEFGA